MRRKIERDLFPQYRKILEKLLEILKLNGGIDMTGNHIPYGLL